MKKPAKKQIKKAGVSKNTNLNNSNKTGIQPLGDRVLVKPIDPADLNTTASGIIIPETVSKEKPEQGEVIAVGEGRWQDGKKIPVTVKVGDRIVFSRYGYEDVKIDGVEYYILKEESILAVINK